jgi:hypothetical protein
VSLKAFCISTAATISKMTPVPTLHCYNHTPNVFVGANVPPDQWRSLSLRERFGTFVNTTYPCYLDFDPRLGGEKTCNDACRRISRHTSIILAAMNLSLATTSNEWSLFFEDDAILNDRCTDYCLPYPIPSNCEYVSLDVRGYPRSRKLNSKYARPTTTRGYGTAGFWFRRSFARRMLNSAVKGLGNPPDLWIFDSFNIDRVCLLQHKCTVKHDDSSKLRVRSFHQNPLSAC